MKHLPTSTLWHQGALTRLAQSSVSSDPQVLKETSDRCADSDNMLPPLVICKGCPTGKQIDVELPEGVIAVCQEKGWMDGKVMHIYLDHTWRELVEIP